MVADIIIAILATLLILEILLRVYTGAVNYAKGGRFLLKKAPEEWNPAPAIHHRLLYKRHPYIIWVNRENARTDWPADGNIYKMGTNNFGFAGTKDTTKEKPEGTIRIICLGGSTTEENTGYDCNETYPHFLEEELQKSFDKNIEVLNAGVASYSSAENLINLQLRLLDFQPDMILIYHAINDAIVGSLKDFKTDYSHSRVNNGVEPNFWNRTPLFPYSFLYSLIRRETIRLFGKSHWLIPNISNWPMVGAETFNQQAVDSFKRNMKNICSIAVSNKVLPVVIKMNYNPVLDRGAMSDVGRLLDLQASDNIFIETLKGNIDSLKEVAEDITGTIYIETKNLKEENYRDNWHLTAEGKRIFAKELAERLTPVLKEKYST